MRIGIFLLRTSLVALFLVAAGCEQRPDATTEKAVEERTKQLNELQEKRENLRKQLQAMDVKQLAHELEAASQKGLEPFNSMAFREMVSRGEAAGSELKPLLTQADHKSLLGLLALRKISPTQYRSLEAAFRVHVLVDALRTSKYFNKWGLPHLYWEDAAKAIIAEGKAAEPSLIALLKDTREAPMWGSEEVVEYQKYHYRVCDYAWALLTEIRGQKVEIPVDPAERDKLIAGVS